MILGAVPHQIGKPKYTFSLSLTADKSFAISGLAFSIDKDTENTVVKVTDLNTEKLVRQIPSEDFLKLAERLKDMRDNTSVSKKDTETKGILFDEKA